MSLALALAAVLAAAPAEAATTLNSVRLTPDSAIVLGSNNQIVTPQDVARHVPGGTAALEAGSPFVGPGVRISGYHYIAAAQQWFAFDNAVTLDAITFEPRDVAQWDGGVNWTYVLDGAAEGIPDGVQVDAVAREPASGDLLVSFDSTVTLDGVTFDPRDIARFSGGAFSMYQPLSSVVPAGLNLTGLDVLPAGRLLISFDGSGGLGGISFDDEDILEYDPNTGAWEMSYDGSAEDADWPPAEMAAFTAEPSRGILVTPTSGLITTESGGTANFQVALLAAPTSNVVIGLSSSDPTEGAPSSLALIFTPANWNIAQTVTVSGINDAIVDGAQPYTIITAAAVSADPGYNNLNAADVSVTNLDNDGPGISVLPAAGLITSESGGTASFQIVLNTQPTANVTIGLSSSDLSEGTVSPPSLIFTSANWSTPHTVTVTGVDDALIDGNIAYTVVTGLAVSADASYNGRNVADAAVVNIDNDAPGITVSPTSGLVTTESGGQASFQVVLNTPPTADVTIALSVDDPSEGQVTPSSLTFTPANWAAPQTVIVTGVDDHIEDGDQLYLVVTAPASSTDASYNGIDPADVSVTNLDNGISPRPVPTLSQSAYWLTVVVLLLVAFLGLRKRTAD